MPYLTPAAGIRVLIVEDEQIVAVLAEDLLASIGCVVAGTAATLSEARAKLDDPSIDVVMLDINLDGENGLELAQVLEARNLPFFITSGYAGDGMARANPGVPVIDKPYTIAALEAAILHCVGRS